MAVALIVFATSGSYVVRLTGNDGTLSTTDDVAITVNPVGTNINSADRMIWWTGLSAVANMSDTDLDTWKARGVDGFVLQTNHLRGLGGSQDWTGDPSNPLIGSNYDSQRSLRDTNIVARAAAKGIKMYLGFWTSNYNNLNTPLKDWFDDAGWANVVIPAVRNMAGAAKLLGFAGLAVDQEPYPGVGGAETGLWKWNYPGNTHTEAETRDKVRQRGSEMMTAVLSAFPNVEMAVYWIRLPESWDELLQQVVNGNPNAFASWLGINFWNGWSGVDGYSAIRIYDQSFFKGTNISSATWDNALQYNANRIYAVLSRNWSNWDYASSRVQLTPFGWIDNNYPDEPSSFSRPPAYVADQLDNFRQWGAGGEFAIYDHGGFSFDYTTYVSGMVAASTPGIVDSQAPGLTVTPTPPASTTATTVNITGNATDNLAIRAVHWVNNRGGGGDAQLTWSFTGSYSTSYTWQMNWTINGIPLQTGANQITITAEDIKGMKTSTIVNISRTSSLMAAGGEVVGSPTPAIRDRDLRKLTHAAVAYWALNGQDVSALANVDVRIASLSGAQLGRTFSNVVMIDSNAAGHGCFVDRTPWEDSEFRRRRQPEGIDLFSALVHEFGHILGQGHVDDADDVMYDTLAEGVRTAK